MIDYEFCRYLDKAPPAEAKCNEDSPCGRKNHSFYFSNVSLKKEIDIVDPQVATTSPPWTVFQNTKGVQVKSLYLQPLGRDHLS